MFQIEQFEYVCASYAKFLPIPLNIIIKQQDNESLCIDSDGKQEEEEVKSLTKKKNGLKEKKEKGKEISHMYLLAI